MFAILSLRIADLKMFNTSCTSGRKKRYLKWKWPFICRRKVVKNHLFDSLQTSCMIRRIRSRLRFSGGRFEGSDRLRRLMIVHDGFDSVAGQRNGISTLHSAQLPVVHSLNRMFHCSSISSINLLSDERLVAPVSMHWALINSYLSMDSSDIFALEKQLDLMRISDRVDCARTGRFLIPDLFTITQASYYWGAIDRYEAERLLENEPEGTFLLRDSVQSDYLFSVSFRRYQRTLHARIEQFNHRFSFDSSDDSVFKASTVTELIEHYKDEDNCLFYEPHLSLPLRRKSVFSLKQLSRAVVCNSIRFEDITTLDIPTVLKNYLSEYHYECY
ncbi:Suppressor of cytokine signaling 5 [Trichinella patagoniensis]|uniref:Suppressor of cytokine signaling 5 n=1 Tax=Trichinella patagoniensis TaxID=990121 RepID=A0A0V0ZE97_9BILA|nr:Suppressor of cytokine signaling 5 [Trichinella patagoniensis]